MKRLIHMSVGFLLATVLISAMSACCTVDTYAESSEVILEDTGAESSEAILEQSAGSFSTEYEILPVESEAPSAEADMSLLFQACSISTDEMENFGYWLYTPENPAENMPLIVYLHGASGRGEDLNLVVADEDFPKYLKTGELGDVRAYVLIPQLPAELRSWRDIGDSLYSLIQKTVSDLSIDKENISLSGFSMGGTAVWELAAEYPDLFARIAPLAGSARGVLDQISVLQEISVWTFVGSADTVIAPNSSEQMVAELKKAGATADITEFDSADHVSVPSLTYLDENIRLVDWLIGNVE